MNKVKVPEKVGELIKTIKEADYTIFQAIRAIYNEIIWSDRSLYDALDWAKNNQETFIDLLNFIY